MDDLGLTERSPDAPPPTADQRKQALETANVKRTALAELKRELAAGTRAEGARAEIGLLESRDARIANVDLGPFLLWVPRVGRRQVKLFLMRNQLSVWARCGALTPRQRGVVLDFLRAHA